MKRVIYLLLVLLPVISTAEWVPYGPSGIIATNICYGVYNAHDLICTPDGFYLHDGPGGSWEFYSYGQLPVWGACYVNNYHFLVVLGDGSYSDGIHYFNTQTHEFEFEMVEWLYKPTFAFYSYNNSCYFVGHEYGLKYSENGFDWVDIPYFNDLKCVDMAEYGDKIILLTNQIDNNIYFTDDEGSSWSQGTTSFHLSDIDYSNYGKIFGIFPGFSNSSGLYSSDDGFNWSLEIWLDDIGCMKTEVMGNVALGWRELTSGYEGIHLYNPLSGSLTDISDNLPNKSINRISYNPWMSVIHLFCCTNDGVYFSYDYMTDVEDKNTSISPECSCYPNPFDDFVTLSYDLKSVPDLPPVISIFNLCGDMVFEKSIFSNQSAVEININTSTFNAGIYYYTLDLSNKKITGKMVKSR
jgi:hypothetical protein